MLASYILNREIIFSGITQVNWCTMKINTIKHAIFYIFSLFLLACSETDNAAPERNLILNLGGESFSIPAGYIWDYDSVKDNRIQGPNLLALYPGFEPMTRSRRDLIESQGWAGGKLITFLFIERSKSKGAEQIIENALKKGIVKKYDADGGLSVYSHYIKNREFIIGSWSKDGSPVYFSCNSVGAVPFPSCRTRVVLNNQILLHITFSRSLLREWEQLCEKLLLKVNEFRT